MKDGHPAQKGCIVTFSGIKSFKGLVSAAEVYRRLRDRGLWYVRRRIIVDAGTVIFFYQRAVGIVGRGIVSESGIVTSKDSTLLHSLGLDTFSSRIVVVDWVTFAQAIKIGALVDQLTFVSNKRNWGASLQTSPKFIGADDIEKLNTAATLA